MPIGLHTAELNFETLREIGQEGRNSKVYIARDKQLDAEIVVKKILKTSLRNADEYYEEAKKLNTSAHTNVVKVSYGCADIEHIYIAMPYYAKGSLKSLLAERYLTVREVIRYSIQFLSELHHIHSKGLMHLDIKPDNILISDSDEALLSDFGLAKFLDGNGYANPSNFYHKQIPPEIFSQTDKTIRFDIYLAGLTIYRLLNGDEHFNDQFNAFLPLDDEANKQAYIQAIINGDFPNRSSYLPHIPVQLQKLVNKALSIDIIDRHTNVLELINKLSEIDKLLDWQYKVDNSTRTWSKDNKGTITEVILTTSADCTYNISTIKIINNNSRRVTTHCHSQLTSFKTELKRALNS